MPLELRFLPAREGDAIWVRWGDDLRHQLLVDMGKEETGAAIRARFEALPEPDREFALLVVTHVDGDHIGGVLTGLAEAAPLRGLAFRDVWFNGWTHLDGRTVPAPGAPRTIEGMGPAQGERLTSWLKGPWNEAFGRGPVWREEPLRTVSLEDGLTLTVLAPTAGRLRDLKPTWKTEVELALAKGSLKEAAPGLEAMGHAKPTKPDLATPQHLRLLAERDSKPDPSLSNGTSITLLLEWRGRRVLLTGDAWAPDVVEGLGRLGLAGPVPLDLVKLPHHGSEGNVSAELVRAVTSPAWVFSSDGTRHHHPHAAAVARVVREARPPAPRLLFNVPSEFNGWWHDEAWRKRFGYSAETGTTEDGMVVTLLPD